MKYPNASTDPLDLIELKLLGSKERPYTYQSPVFETAARQIERLFNEIERLEAELAIAKKSMLQPTPAMLAALAGHPGKYELTALELAEFVKNSYMRGMMECCEGMKFAMDTAMKMLIAKNQGASDA